jgi:hypothetical protein
MNNAETELKEAFAPLRKYLKAHRPTIAVGDRWASLYMMSPAEARRLLKQVQEVEAGLLEIERELVDRAAVTDL